MLRGPLSAKALPDLRDDADRRARFMLKVRVEGECWRWTASMSGAYGQFRVGREMHKAPRVSYALHVGALAEGVNLLHSCDHPWCVRPDHTRPGTPQENSDDMFARGREQSAGDRNWQRKHPERVPRGDVRAKKLSAAIVVEIRKALAAGALQRELAAKYGVNQTMISAIVCGRAWA